MRHELYQECTICNQTGFIPAAAGSSRPLPCPCASRRVVPVGVSLAQLDALAKKAKAFDVLVRREWAVHKDKPGTGLLYIVGKCEGKDLIAERIEPANATDVVLEADRTVGP